MKRVTSPGRTPFGRPFGKYTKLSSEQIPSGGFPNARYHAGDDHVTINIPDDYISRASRFKPSQLLTRARNLGRVARSYFPVRYSKGEPLISGGVSKTRSVRAFINRHKRRLLIAGGIVGGLAIAGGTIAGIIASGNISIRDLKGVVQPKSIEGEGV